MWSLIYVCKEVIKGLQKVVCMIFVIGIMTTIMMMKMITIIIILIVLNTITVAERFISIAIDTDVYVYFFQILEGNNYLINLQ